MAKGYRPVARDQQFLLPPDMREWLPGEHPVWLVIDAVAGHLDTAALHRGRRAGGGGGAGLEPGMVGAAPGWADCDGGGSLPRDGEGVRAPGGVPVVFRAGGRRPLNG